MIVYVETNFLLQLMWQQEASDHASKILEGAKSKAYDLVAPAFALIEPAWTLPKREQERKGPLDIMAKHVREIRRSPHRTQVAAVVQQAVDQIRELEKEDKAGFDDTVIEMRSACRLLPIERATIDLALIDQYRFDLRFVDAVILASILIDLSGQDDRPKVFSTEDRRDFNKPDVKDELAKHNCTLISSFEHTVKFLERDATN